MNDTAGIQDLSQTVAAILESVPESTDGAISLDDLCRNAGSSEPNCIEQARALVAILKAFDAISIFDEDEPDGPRIKASSPTAGYFLKSLAAYLRENRKVLSNWERPGVSKGPYLAHEILSGAQFLYIMEDKRASDREDAVPIRKTSVAKAIIKARIRGVRHPVFLVQFDPFARQYQLIGGHKRKTDADVSTAMRREIREELSQNALRFPSDYDLRNLNVVCAKELSLTYGAFSQYDLHYFQPIFKRSQLILGPNDLWVTKKELISGKTRNGMEINESAISELDQSLPGGLDGLGLSLAEVQRRTLLQLAKDHPWESIGLGVSFIGIILSIVFFLLSR